jgi:hypothetical protein
MRNLIKQFQFDILSLRSLLKLIVNLEIVILIFTQLK